MSGPKARRPQESKVPFKLSRRELDLLKREAAPALGLAQEIPVLGAEGGRLIVALPLRDWEELAGYLSVQSYRGESPKVQDQLDRLIERIEDLIDEHDEPGQE